MNTAAKPRRKWPVGRIILFALILLLTALIVYLTVHGWMYYRLGPEERPFSPLHPQLRSSGVIGVRLGMLGVALFGVLFLYPLRKRWRWLASIGTTRQWLNIHVVMGISAPIIISFHSSFRWHGLAGLAYWIMVVVALSGFIGRYVYAQIPRSLTSAALTLDELRAQTAALRDLLSRQHTIAAEHLEALLRTPSAAEVKRMSALQVVSFLAFQDALRVLRTAALRRRFLTRTELLTTICGFLPSRHAGIEAVISMAKRESWLATKTAFLKKTERVFHLWHVIHRPFSISFVLLVVIHISVILLLGYY